MEVETKTSGVHAEAEGGAGGYVPERGGLAGHVENGVVSLK